MAEPLKIRREPRFKTETPVSIQVLRDGAQEYDGMIVDASSQGLGIAALSAFKPGEVVRICNATDYVFAVVRNCSALEGGYMVGVQRIDEWRPKEQMKSAAFPSASDFIDLSKPAGYLGDLRTLAIRELFKRTPKSDPSQTGLWKLEEVKASQPKLSLEPSEQTGGGAKLDGGKAGLDSGEAVLKQAPSPEHPSSSRDSDSRDGEDSRDSKDRREDEGLPEKRETRAATVPQPEITGQKAQEQTENLTESVAVKPDPGHTPENEATIEETFGEETVLSMPAPSPKSASRGSREKPKKSSRRSQTAVVAGSVIGFAAVLLILFGASAGIGISLPGFASEESAAETGEWQGVADPVQTADLTDDNFIVDLSSEALSVQSGNASAQPQGDAVQDPAIPEALSPATETEELAGGAAANRATVAAATPQENPNSPNINASGPNTSSSTVSLPGTAVSAGGEAVLHGTAESWVTVCADGDRLFAKLFSAGTQEIIPFSQNVIVRAGRSGAMEVSVNGTNHGAMGPAGETRTVEYTAAGTRPIASGSAADCR